MRRILVSVILSSLILMGCGGDSKITPTDATVPDTVEPDVTDPDVTDPDVTDPDTIEEETTITGPNCDDYCTAIQAACVGDAAQYSSKEECLDYCTNVAAFEAGNADEATGNTIGCRTYHAGVAADADPDIHCAHAGPTGGDACGAWCENYCHLAQKNCTDDTALYADDTACATACDAFRTDGLIGDATGDTVQCRLYHLGTPAAGDPTTHCGHGGETATDFCLDPCEPQCDGKVCGDDGCGNECGTCADGEVCNAGACCTPTCANEGGAMDCGDDGCGGSCGDCAEGEVCNGGACCAPACTNEDGSAKGCGDNGCGDVCGTCAAGEICTDAGACCAPSCANEDGSAKVCGDNGCGDVCGDCAEGEGCDDSGQCYVLCTPNCITEDGSTKACGDDGCSGSCGDCAPEEGCTNAGQCVVPGPMCVPLELNCGDALTGLSNDMVGSTQTLSFSDFSCSPSAIFGGADYSNMELAYTISVPTDQWVTVEMSGTIDVDMMLLEDEGLGCSPSGTNCLGGSLSEVSWAAKAGSTYYIVLEHYDGGTDTFDLDVSCCTPDCSADPCGDDGCGGTCNACTDGQLCYEGMCCVPDCAGKICGADGCGSNCGNCDVGELCSDTQDICAAPVGGDTCADALEIAAVPFSASSDSSVFANDYEFGDGECPGVAYGKGGGSMDVVYTFTPATSGGYNIDLNSVFDAALYVVTDCADIENTCQGAEETASSNATEKMLVSLEAGTTYFIVVDGYSSFSDNSGPYTLTVDLCAPVCTASDGSTMVCGDNQCGGDCGSCAPTEICNEMGQCDAASVGDNCGNPFLVDGLPYSYDGDTATGSNAMSYGDGECPGETYGEGEKAQDNVFLYEAMADTALTVTLNPSAGFDAALFVLTDCSDVGGSCVGAIDDSGTEELVFPVLSGTSYYIVVDGYNTDSGGYNLSITECETTCDASGAVCGDDGCGGTCGDCGLDEACNEGLCIVLGPGDTCGEPILVDATPFSHTNTTEFATDDYGYDSDVCPGESSGWGGGTGDGGPDHVFLFTPPATAVYDITLDSDFDSNLYVATDCAAINSNPSSCIAASENYELGVAAETLQLSLDAGTDYYIFVDGWANLSVQSGTYTLHVDACLTTCDTNGAICGDDGCGGSCGECTAMGENCLNGQCVGADAPGDTCDNPIWATDIPFTYTGDTGLGTTNDSYSYGDGACDGETYGSGGNQQDNVIAFTPTVSGAYDIKLDASFDSALYLVTDCADVNGSCLGADEKFAEEQLQVALDAGITYYVIVDGYESVINTYDGAYSLTIDMCPTTCDANGAVCGDDGCGGTCGDCGLDEACDEGLCIVLGPGDTCSDPIMVDALPFSHAGDTSFSNNDYGYSSNVCPGSSGLFGGNGANDDVFSFTPTETAEYTISFSGFDGNLYIVTDCADIDNACVAGSETFGNTEEVTTTLDVGITYFIIVDGWGNTSNSETGPYTLSISQEGGCVPTCVASGSECGDDGCNGSCGDCNPGESCENGQCTGGTTMGGDTCDDAVVIDTFPFTYSGTTAGAVDNYNADKAANCDTFFSDGLGVADVAFTITPPSTGTYEFELTASGNFAPSYFILTTDCASLPTSCDQAEDVWSGGTMSSSLAGGATYFLIVTGGDASEAGPYTLEVTSPTLCVPDCTDATGNQKACGDDGCQGTCGVDCIGGQTCTSDGQCVVDAGTVGDTCDNPFMVYSFPYAASGDTTLMAEDYNGGATCDDVGGFGNGAGANDSVYALTATASGEYIFTLTCTGANGCGPTFMYLVSDCGDTENSCLGDSDDMFFGNGGELIVTLDAGNTYYLIVDGTTLWDYGAYDLTIDAPDVEVAGLDISGWVLKGENASKTPPVVNPFIFPVGTTLAAGAVVVFGRNVTEAEFEAHWGALPDVTYFDGANKWPIINGNYTFTLLDSNGQVMDGPTVTFDSGSLARVSPDLDAGLMASWVAGDVAAATPGVASAPSEAEAGSFYISEMSDAGSGLSKYEFLELHLTGGEAAGPEVVDVSIENYSFTPADITVVVGATVRWTNGATTNHTVTTADANNGIVVGGELDSPHLGNGETYEHTFATAGVYPYRCGPHASMTGTVTVQ